MVMPDDSTLTDVVPCVGVRVTAAEPLILNISRIVIGVTLNWGTKFNAIKINTMIVSRSHTMHTLIYGE